MKKLLALLFLFSALPLFGQGTSFPVFNRQGWTMAGAVVGTCQGPANPGTATLYCTSPVTTYTDWTLVVPCTQVTTIPNPPGPPLGPVSGVGCTNPGLTDSHGNATIFAANGFYWALVSGYQVVPQTFPFSIGGGGGGGGGNPCGTTYDVQLNISNGFGCDTGIFIETPSNHTTYNNVFSANQQLDVSDSAHTGIVDIGHSTGTVVDGHFQQSLSSAFTAPGYGINWPNGPVAGALTITSLTPDANGLLPTAWAPSVPGLVSLENLPYIYTVPCNSPTTCSDLVPVPVPYAPSNFLGGPPQNTGNLGYVTNTALAQDNTGSLSTATVTLPNTYTQGNSLVVQITSDGGGTVGPPTDTCGNVWTTVYAIGNQGVWYAKNTVKCLTADVISVPITVAGGWMISAGEVINGGVLDTFSQGGSCSVSSPYTITYTSLTTAQPDILVVLENQEGPGGGPYGTYAEGSGFTMEVQGTHYGGGGLGNSRSMMIEWGAANSAGAHNATSIWTLNPGGGGCGPSHSFTLAFKPIVSTLPGNPTPRYVRKLDLEASGDYPPTASGDAGKSLVVDPTGTKYILGAIPGAGITSIQMQNNGTNYGSAATGATTFNFVNCTVSGTSPSFTITCTSGVTTTGSPVSGNLTKFSGASSITNGDLSGDVTTSGTLAATVANLSSVTNHSLPNTGLAIPGTFQAGFPAIATAQTAFAIVSNAMTFAANFGSVGGIASSVKCGTNPGGTVVFTLTDITTSTTLGTISVSTSCVGTFATTGGTTQAVSANDFLTLVSGTDATGANIAFNLRATRN